MKILGVHPGPLMYTKIFLRLEPLGLELVAAAVRRAGHEVRLIDLQVESHRDFFRLIDAWRPDLIEFSRGCPWDCSFCSAWTFYGRSYRLVGIERAVEDLCRVREPGVFIVDDVAFVHEEHGMALGEAVASAGIQKNYYLETRGDVL